MKILLSTVFAFAFFSPVAPAQSPPTSLEIHCPVRLPTQRDVSAVLGVANFSQAFAARERLMHYAQRACRRGSASLRVIADDDSSRPLRDTRALIAVK
ncbi:MAG: hypothetical protein ABI386_12500 [Rhodanobacter sp.]